MLFVTFLGTGFSLVCCGSHNHCFRLVQTLYFWHFVSTLSKCGVLILFSSIFPGKCYCIICFVTCLLQAVQMMFLQFSFRFPKKKH